MHYAWCYTQLLTRKDKRGMKKPNISINYSSEKSQIINTDEGSFLFSYNTLIAGIINGKVYLNEKYWDYSVTTGKHRNKFLGEGIAETRKKIKSGEYQFFE
jgi:uncharacterized protein affecting Mg2+/Co2+ transport